MCGFDIDERCDICRDARGADEADVVFVALAVASSFGQLDLVDVGLEYDVNEWYRGFCLVENRLSHHARRAAPVQVGFYGLSRIDVPGECHTNIDIVVRSPEFGDQFLVVGCRIDALCEFFAEIFLFGRVVVLLAVGVFQGVASGLSGDDGIDVRYLLRPVDKRLVLKYRAVGAYIVVSFFGEYCRAEHFEDVGDELRLCHLGQGLRGIESVSDIWIVPAGCCIGDAVSVILPRFGLVGSEYGHTIEIVLDLRWED